MIVKTSDRVDIVRCCECKWWNPPTVGITGGCAMLRIHITGEFYCANGERLTSSQQNEQMYKGGECYGRVDRRK